MKPEGLRRLLSRLSMHSTPLSHVDSSAESTQGIRKISVGLANTTLISLPSEIRRIILSHIFTSRIINFHVPQSWNTEGSHNTNARKVLRDWHLAFLRSSRQLHTEGIDVLRNAISNSTLVLDGISPAPNRVQDKLDRHLYTRRMLVSFLRQHASLVQCLRIANAPTTGLDFSCFQFLKYIVFEENIFSAFDVVMPTIGGSNLVIAFPDFEPGASDDAVRDAVMRRYEELKDGEILRLAFKQNPWNPTIAGFLVTNAIYEHQADVGVSIVLKVVSASTIQYGNADSPKMELVIDGKTEKIVSFRRP